MEVLRKPGQFVVVLFLLLSAGTLLFAESPRKSSKAKPQSKFRSGGLHKGRTELSFWSGYSFNSMEGKFLALTPDRQFAIIGLQYGRILAAKGHIALAYTFDLIPMAMVTNNPKTEIINQGIFSTEYVREKSVYGFGAAPIGFKFYFLQTMRLKFFANASGGFLSFRNEVPVEDARKFNFTFDFGLGSQLTAGSHWALTFGYRLHHISNAKTAEANPGLDSGVFYLGVSSFR